MSKRRRRSSSTPAKRDPKTLAFWAFIAVALVVGAGMYWATSARPSETPAYVSSYTPAVQPKMVPVFLIGDSYTGGSDQGGNDGKGWPRLVNRNLLDSGVGINIMDTAVGGAGYVAPAPKGETFRQLAGNITSDAKAVVVFGSRNDGGRNVSAAANELFADIKAKAPDATLLVIGPPWINENVPAPILSIRDQLRTEAAAVGATFVDPVAEGWFFGDKASLIGADGVHPTDEGHIYMAELIQPHIVAAIS
ncbi:SGNH/GDSL hydrolase family protein [Rhodococcus qingshengii]|uniref:SGNH/GDSL hydrolase family protein n=1 Tax=Rhodococcus qingshengii TaxID=334542 RepID=UPI00287FCCC8|nr:SGNH/GDSL hydrolase family protein [Rhodococcus qingshengii]